MLLLCMARPELLDRRPSWGGGKLHAVSVLLDPLKDEECDALITNLLHGETLEPGARRLIAEATEHNPLFIEELVKTLVEDGVLRPVDGSWVADADVADLPIPPTSKALLAARVDALRPPERLLVERASVIGKLFHLRALAELLPQTALDDLDETIASLMRKDVLCPDRSSFLGDEAFRSATSCSATPRTPRWQRTRGPSAMNVAPTGSSGSRANTTRSSDTTSSSRRGTGGSSTQMTSLRTSWPRGPRISSCRRGIAPLGVETTQPQQRSSSMAYRCTSGPTPGVVGCYRSSPPP